MRAQGANTLLVCAAAALAVLVVAVDEGVVRRRLLGAESVVTFL